MCSSIGVHRMWVADWARTESGMERASVRAYPKPVLSSIRRELCIAHDHELEEAKWYLNSNIPNVMHNRDMAATTTNQTKQIRWKYDSNHKF